MPKYVDIELGSGARLPYKRHSGDAGWDLYVSRDAVIAPGQVVDVHTDVRVKLPPRTYIRITGRSSSLRKHKLLINEGIIDNGFTGELFICVLNLGTEAFHVKRGMRLAQVLFHTIDDVRWCQVDDVGPSADGRGTDGFGSTGV